MNKEEKNSAYDLSCIQTRFPSPLSAERPDMTSDEKVDAISKHFREIMVILGLDIEDESLKQTPNRVAKMYVNEIFSGLDSSTFPKILFVENKYQHQSKNNIVFVKVNFTSFCEHHFVPMQGTAYVAYVPNKRLIGLSKIPRIVKFFSQRPQLQERLSAQIADCLSTLLETDDVAVSITAQHYCMIARGIEDCTSHTITNVLRGEFDVCEKRRREFFDAVERVN
jgi:GTP cyclohydrolase I